MRQLFLFDIQCKLKTYLCTMAKAGSAKNTKNKAKHTKLMTRKLNKERAAKELRVARLKDVLQRAKNADL
jgi:hypothetical protein